MMFVILCLFHFDAFSLVIAARRHASPAAGRKTAIDYYRCCLIATFHVLASRGFAAISSLYTLFFSPDFVSLPSAAVSVSKAQFSLGSPSSPTARRFPEDAAPYFAVCRDFPP